MKKKDIIALITLGALTLMMGCAGAGGTPTTGIVITNELSSERMQPGGTVQLRTSVNNYFDNPLRTPLGKIVRGFGELTYSANPISMGAEVQNNPNATARATWTITISRSATGGTEYTNRVRLCFQYTQTAWHEIGLVNSFDIETSVSSGADTGPMRITFSGLDNSYIRNEQITAEVPISIGIKNDYAGRVGPMNLPGDVVANITKVIIRIYDRNVVPDNTSPGTVEKSGVFDILEEYNSPVNDPNELQTGDLICSNKDIDVTTGYPVSYKTSNGKYYECYIENMTVFGTETFINARLNVTNLLESEEIIEKVEVEMNYDYCIESTDFTLTVFQPGG